MGKHHITPRLRCFKPRSRLFLVNLLWGKGSRGMGWCSPSELSRTLSWENVLHLHLVQQSNQWSIGLDCWVGKLCLFWLSYFYNLTLTLKLPLYMGSPRFPDQCFQGRSSFKRISFSLVSFWHPLKHHDDQIDLATQGTWNVGFFFNISSTTFACSWGWLQAIPVSRCRMWLYTTRGDLRQW